MLGVDPDHPSPIVEIKAPVSGVISDQQVTNASGVQGLASPSPFTISDLSRVWIVCDVFENDLGTCISASSAEYPLERLSRPRHYRTVAISARFSIRISGRPRCASKCENPGLMRPGMFVTATFHGPRKKRAQPFRLWRFCICTIAIGSMFRPMTSVSGAWKWSAATCSPVTCRKSFQACARAARNRECA